MKRNVLVTGSDGFIGKNLIGSLNKKNDIRILTFTRKDNDTTLAEHLAVADYVVHLAGEVRPNSSNLAFHSANVSLTERILKALQGGGLRTPVLLVSSIHANLLKNDYGKTKRAAELLVEDYVKGSGSSSHIVRLPHVFGEGCKPNYNSVITTWICNIISNKEITIYDREILMEYVYVKDIVKDFIGLIVESEEELYVAPSISYKTTLGEVVDYLKAFQAGDTSTSSEFQKKLYDTFMFYKDKSLFYGGDN